MTTFFIDYDTIITDCKAVVDSGSLGFKKVMIDAMDRDGLYDNMPLLDLRIRRSTPDALGGQNYYADITVEAEITTFDMTSLREAAKMRNDLLGKLQKFLQQNPHFSSASDTVLIGNSEFGTGEDPKTGAFLAAVVADFHIKLYADQG